MSDTTILPDPLPEPRRLWIPQIGECIELTKDWTFDLFKEHRNLKLFEMLFGSVGDTHWSWYGQVRDSKPVTFPARTVLRVDRIYVRKGAPDFDSMTFFVAKCALPALKKKRPRFWAKLWHVNQLVGKPVVP